MTEWTGELPIELRFILYLLGNSNFQKVLSQCALLRKLYNAEIDSKQILQTLHVKIENVLPEMKYV